MVKAEGQHVSISRFDHHQVLALPQDGTRISVDVGGGDAQATHAVQSLRCVTRLLAPGGAAVASPEDGATDPYRQADAGACTTHTIKVASRATGLLAPGTPPISSNKDGATGPYNKARACA